MVAKFQPLIIILEIVIAVSRGFLFPSQGARSKTEAIRSHAKSLKGPGLVFPIDNDIDCFDGESVGMPVVFRYQDEMGERWKMWYHGRNEEFQKDQNVIDIGTGRIGLAYSSNGIDWVRDAGEMMEKSVLCENSDHWWSFDTAHVGLGDVYLGLSEKIRTDGGIYFMYYFGGSFVATDLSKYNLTMGAPGVTKGIKMKIGVAVSQDGLNWSRIEGEHADGSILDCGVEGEWDELFVGWPTVLCLKEKDFRMYYHSMNPMTKTYNIGMATSKDGIKWQKCKENNPIITGGKENNWDSRGASRRCIIQKDSLFLMFYEGVDKSGKHSIGLMTSFDGIRWERDGSGLPIFEPNDDPDCWDSGGVTSPRGNGKYWMYYVGYSKSSNSPGRIGVAESIGGNIKQWKRVDIEKSR